MNFLQKWFFKRKINQIRKIGDFEAQLDNILKDTSIDYQKAVREAEKINKIKEAKRRVEELRDISDDYEEEDQEESITDGIDPMIMKLIQGFIAAKAPAADPGNVKFDPLMPPTFPGETKDPLALTKEEIEMARNFLRK